MMSFAQAQEFGGHFGTAPSPGYQYIPAFPTPSIPPGVPVTHEGLPRVVPAAHEGSPRLLLLPVWYLQFLGGSLPFLHLFLWICQWLLLR
jgi:hypothetical protein